MQEEPNEVKVKLVVTSADFPCELVTETLKINPSRTWSKGDRIGRFSKRKAKENGWIFQVQKDGIEDTETLVWDLLSNFSSASEKLLDLQRRYEMGVEVVIFANKYMPYIIFSPGLMKELTALNLSIEFDIYALYE
ncbi:MAG: DUF4279 domain-containing protein [Acidobacteriota bacterium]